jgi:exoribonuclease R
MAESDRRAGKVTRACTDAVEAAELQPYVGKDLDAVVVDEHERGVVVQLTQLAVVGSASGRAEPGERVRIRVLAAEIETGTVKLQVL